MPGAQCRKSHCRKQPLLSLNACDALALQHEEVLLGRVGVVEPTGLTGVEHGQLDPELLEALRLKVGPLTQRGHVRLEEATGAERLVRHPGSISDVHDEPAR